MEHSTRIRAAEHINEKAAARAEESGAYVVCYRASNTQRNGKRRNKMKLFNGIHLTGSVKDSHEGDVENGCEYEVVSVTADQLRVRLVGQEEASI